jgi:hypothetical protein
MRGRVSEGTSIIAHIVSAQIYQHLQFKFKPDLRDCNLTRVVQSLNHNIKTRTKYLLPSKTPHPNHLMSPLLHTLRQPQRHPIPLIKQSLLRFPSLLIRRKRKALPLNPFSWTKVSAVNSLTSEISFSLSPAQYTATFPGSPCYAHSHQISTSNSRPPYSSPWALNLCGTATSRSMPAENR